MIMVAEANAGREAFDMDGLIGTVVNGRFHIVERIARGGMANVYFATQAPLNRAVAVKVLHGIRNEEAESEDSFRGRFLQEASILAKLQHPNIVVLLDYGQIDELPGEHFFMAMEYLRGETLAQRFRAHGRLSKEESIRLTRQIGRGLREAHRSGFVHRDLKPSNIILVPEDENNYIVKLVDFGVGKAIPGVADQLREVEDATRAGLLLGSPRYMSPEQIRSDAIEPRTDIYALGVILFQALTGRLPFEARNEVDLLMAHCLTPAPTIREARPEEGFPDSLSKLVAGMLEKQPSRRPTVEEFLEELALIEEEVFGVVNLAGPTLQSLLPNLSTGRGRHDSIPPGSLRPLSSSWRARQGVGTELATIPAPSLAAVAASGGGKRKKLLLLLPLFALPVVVWLLLRWVAPGAPSASIAAPPSTGSLAPAVSAGVAAPDVAAQPPAFELTVRSIPAQALVSEGGIVLGRTPLVLTIDRASVAVNPRRFLLRREGYVPHALEQRDSDVAVQLSVKLEPERRGASARSPARSSSAAASAAVKETPTPKRGEPPSLDIRLRR